MTEDGNWIYVDTGKGGWAICPTEDNMEGEIAVPESIDGIPVIELYPGAFANSNITGVTIPDSVINIGSGAFAGSGNLEHVYFPGGSAIIGDGAFAGAGGGLAGGGGTTIHAPGGSSVGDWASKNDFGTSGDMSGAGDTSGIGGSGSGETVEKVEVTLYMNDGTDAVYKKVKTEKDKPLNIVSPKRDGFTFTGWYTDKECENKFTSNVTSDMDLYAGWKIEESTPANKIPDSKEEVTYDEELDTDAIWNGANKKVEVYVSQGQDVAVRLPFKVVADGRTGEANIEVEVKANISGTDNIKVIPDTSFEMTTKGKRPISATVEQDQTEFNIKKDGQEALELGKIVNGKIQIHDLSAGFWEGNYVYTIRVEGLKIDDSEENTGKVEVTP